MNTATPAPAHALLGIDTQKAASRSQPRDDGQPGTDDKALPPISEEEDCPTISFPERAEQQELDPRAPILASAVVDGGSLMEGSQATGERNPGKGSTVGLGLRVRNLHKACWEGCLHEAVAILEQEPEIAASIDRASEKTALHFACAGGHMEATCSLSFSLVSSCLDAFGGRTLNIAATSTGSVHVA